jgi:hypothetical protein
MVKASRGMTAWLSILTTVACTYRVARHFLGRFVRANPASVEEVF